MAGTLSLLMQARLTLGAESSRFDLRTAIPAMSAKFDAVVSVVGALANAAANAPVVWQAPSPNGHGQAAPINRFEFLAILVDPDATLATVPLVQVELAFTDAAGAITLHVFTIDKNRPLILGPSDCGTAFSAGAAANQTGQITRIRLASVPAGNVPVRVLFFD